jgi:integrase
MHARLLEWLALLQFLLGHPLEADDYIFPSMTSNGDSEINVYPKQEQSHESVQRRLDAVIQRIGISDKLGKFTTHCFRRGGAQYRFIYAPDSERWSLDRVRWWGHWADGEHVSSHIPHDHCETLLAF